MSRIINFGYTDTAIVPDPGTLTLERAPLNFGADFREQTSQTGELVLTNLSSPYDRPETMRFGYTKIANVYNNSGIDPTVYAPTKSGVSLLCQINETVSVTDSTDPSFRMDFPISAHMVIKVPSSDAITASDVETLVGRLVSTLFDTGASDDTRLKQLLRGALTPKDL
jgi:hypothetical protein